MTTCQEQSSFVCKYVFQQFGWLVPFLPFQDKIDLWDIEEALKAKEYKDNNPNTPFIEVRETTVEYGGETVQAFRIVEFPYRSRHGARLRSAPGPQPIRIYLPELDDDVDGDDEDEEQPPNRDDSGYIIIEYTAMHIKRSRVRRRYSFYIPNIANMTEDEIQERIKAMCCDRDYCNDHIRTDESLPERFEDREFYRIMMYDSDYEGEPEYNYGDNSAGNIIEYITELEAEQF